MIIFISILVLIGFFKAIKDRSETGRPNVFPKNGTFWNKGTGKQFLGYYFDAWHLADSLVWVCVVSLPFVYVNFTPYPLLDACIMISIILSTFNIFYDLIFKP